MKRIFWLAAVAVLMLVAAGVTAKPGSLPIVDEKLQGSVARR